MTTELLAEDEEIHRVVKKNVINISCDHVSSYRNEEGNCYISSISAQNICIYYICIHIFYTLFLLSLLLPIHLKLYILGNFISSI